MKKFSLKFTVVCLMGMITSLFALFQSTNQDQIIVSIWLFITFGVSGTITLLNYEGLK
jgi:putative flippase GtrA